MSSINPTHNTPQTNQTPDVDLNQSAKSTDVNKILGRLLARTNVDDITLLPISSTVSKESLITRFPNSDIIACDFYITGIEHDQPITGGFIDPESRITNIDHHAPMPSMFRYISSGNLAVDYVVENGRAPHTSKVVINHTDCDSVISSLIIRGHIPLVPLFEQAVIAADHTGEENTIADLLQALDPKRDLNFSVRNLAKLLMGEPLEIEAQTMLNNRLLGREETMQNILYGAKINDGLLTVVHLTGNMRNEFMPALLPNAAVILTYEDGDTHGTWVARLRLGTNVPPKFNLLTLDLANRLDIGFGGRWNAMANKRAGGTKMPLKECIDRLRIITEEAVAGFNYKK